VYGTLLIKKTNPCVRLGFDMHAIVVSVPLKRHSVFS
jgi:hypothetical protein